jgi:hypothetical protein
VPQDLFYFAVGAAAGLVIGAGLALVATRVIGLFRTPEETRLAREVRELRRRLERKDRAIDEMLRQAAEVAGRIPTDAPAAPAPGEPREVGRR